MTSVTHCLSAYHYLAVAAASIVSLVGGLVLGVTVASKDAYLKGVRAGVNSALDRFEGR